MVISGLDQVLKDLDGKDLKLSSKDETGLTLEKALVQAVLAPGKEGEDEDKYELYTLAKQIHEKKEVDLTAEQITILKKKVKYVFFPLYVGVIFDLIEPKKESKDA